LERPEGRAARRAQGAGGGGAGGGEGGTGAGPGRAGRRRPGRPPPVLLCSSRENTRGIEDKRRPRLLCSMEKAQGQYGQPTQLKKEKK
jgi:hypothetical protein